MRRTPIVLTGTVAGLAGVLTFHTSPSHLALGTAPGTSAGSGQPASAPSPAAHTSTAGSGSASASGAERTAVGPAVNYNYGILSVKVTISGKKIVKVGIGSINDGGIPLSQSIDQQSIPLLEQEVMQAQSANIQGVSGASYTSAGFEQSLQSALHSLGLR